MLARIIRGIAFAAVAALNILAAHSEIRISIITEDVSEKYVYSAWGHTAVRVLDTEDGLDISYNYGVFSFDDLTKFIVDFVKGDTYYMVAARSFAGAVRSGHRDKGIEIREQVLNLTQDEAKRVKEALYVNALPENREYKYDFFFDNCATRPRLIIEDAVCGRIQYPEVGNKKTYHDFIREALATSPWYHFGIDICLGDPINEEVSDSLMMFMPVAMRNAFNGARIVSADTVRPLVLSEAKIADAVEGAYTPFDFPKPMTVALVFLLAVVLHTIYYAYRHKKDYLWFDPLFFSLYGLFGLLVFFLAFISTHPCVFPNYNIFWLNPLLFAIWPLTKVERWRAHLRKFHFANAVFTILCLSVLPMLNEAFAPFIFASLIRSCSYLWRSKGT